MNNLGISLIKLIIATLFLLSIFPNPTKSDVSSSDYIRHVCKKTPYPELCNKTIRKDPRSSDNTLEAFAEIVFDALEHNSKVGAAKIRKFYGSGAGGTVKDALWKCSKMYIGMMKAAKEGIQKLRDGNSEYAKGYAYIVMMESDRCERQFPDGQSPLTSVNRHGQRLGADAAVIAQMM